METWGGEVGTFGSLAGVCGGRVGLLWSFVYLAVRSVPALVVLAVRRGRSKDLEILVLRHEGGLIHEYRVAA
jgi:hypothetical protein